MNEMRVDFGTLQGAHGRAAATTGFEQAASVLPHGVAAPLPLDFGQPVVFGDPSRPLAGRIHAARGAVLGAVVKCNPWGYEENCSHITFQLLARRLCERGLEVLRFD